MAGDKLGLSRSSDSLNNRCQVGSSRSIDQRSDATWMTAGGQHPMGKGQRLFTGNATV